MMRVIDLAEKTITMFAIAIPIAIMFLGFFNIL